YDRAQRMSLSTDPAPRATLFPYTTLFRSHPLAQDPAVGRGAGLLLEPAGEGPGRHQRTCRELFDADLLVEMLLHPHQHLGDGGGDRKSTRLNSSHVKISYAVFCLKTKNQP